MGTSGKPLNKRRVVSLLLLALLTLLLVSAVVVHVTHGTRASHTWLHLHGLFGVMFIVTGVYHMVYNWRVLRSYFW
ncbi:MAG: hypothetical protein FWG50_09485 [Kiritimatiellaeota bacterium]|nr:hypothetical protein [Kiritimatiellota bacterium]